MTKKASEGVTTTQLQYPGIFITFEGGEGTGKSTQIKKIVHWLKSIERPVVTFREPGSTDLGEEIRSLVISGKQRLEPKAELFLLLASRAHIFQTIVHPNLKKGKIILGDRHRDSSVVYQGYVGKLGCSTIRRFNQFATDGYEPDLTFIFDLDPSVGLKRQNDANCFENEGLAFHLKVRAGYLKEAARDPHRYKVIDVSRDPETIFNEIKAIIQESFPQYQFGGLIPVSR